VSDVAVASCRFDLKFHQLHRLLEVRGTSVKQAIHRLACTTLSKPAAAFPCSFKGEQAERWMTLGPTSRSDWWEATQRLRNDDGW